jgi:hypothetical protein
MFTAVVVVLLSFAALVSRALLRQAIHGPFVRSRRWKPMSRASRTTTTPPLHRARRPPAVALSGPVHGMVERVSGLIEGVWGTLGFQEGKSPEEDILAIVNFEGLRTSYATTPKSNIDPPS